MWKREIILSSEQETQIRYRYKPYNGIKVSSILFTADKKRFHLRVTCSSEKSTRELMAIAKKSETKISALLSGDIAYNFIKEKDSPGLIAFLKCVVELEPETLYPAQWMKLLCNHNLETSFSSRPYPILNALSQMSQKSPSNRDISLKNSFKAKLQIT